MKNRSPMNINRRDFLKLTALLTASAAIKPGFKILPARQPADPDAKNILIIVFDALSAANINFYGYPRQTMPNLTRLLDRATVYHNHYACANFTTPGTASLLTGRYPWDHQALKLSETVRSGLVGSSIFALFDDYFRLGYTHNNMAGYLLNQFGGSLDQHLTSISLYLQYNYVNQTEWFSSLFADDPDLVDLFKSRLTDETLDGYLYRLLFPSLLGKEEYLLPEQIAQNFPRGVPGFGRGFILEDAIDWTLEQAKAMPRPFLSYLHYFPPHSPYHTRIDFVDAFLEDGFIPPTKPRHPVVIPGEFLTPSGEQEFRRQYDEFILYVDAEFERLFSSLDQTGILENTLLVLTTDHGEMFERKVIEHNFPYLYEPLVKIPLVIFDPEQTERRDIYSLTSCVDLLPTLLHYTSHPIPAALPGKILPPYTDPPQEEQKILAMDARWNQNASRIDTATLMMRQGSLKAIRYGGYADHYLSTGAQNKYDTMQSYDDPYYEVFNLQEDPEELENLAGESNSEILSLIQETEAYYQANVEFASTSQDRYYGPSC